MNAHSRGTCVQRRRRIRHDVSKRLWKPFGHLADGPGDLLDHGPTVVVEHHHRPREHDALSLDVANTPRDADGQASSTLLT